MKADHDVDIPSHDQLDPGKSADRRVETEEDIIGSRFRGTLFWMEGHMSADATPVNASEVATAARRIPTFFGTALLRIISTVALIASRDNNLGTDLNCSSLTCRRTPTTGTGQGCPRTKNRERWSSSAQIDETTDSSDH